MSLTTAQIADAVGTTPRNLRKFLRSPDSPYEAVGQGSRYHIEDGDLGELRTKYEAWAKRPGSRSSSTPKKSNKRTAAPEKINPLDGDDLATRMAHSIGDRQRMHGLVCAYTESHPKVRGLDVKCRNTPEKGKRYCSDHTQLVWCYSEDEVGPYCGPKAHRPYCQWHAGDVDIDTITEIAASEHGALMVKAVAGRMREENN